MKRIVRTDCPAQRAEDALGRIKANYDPVIANLSEMLSTYEKGSAEYDTIANAIDLLHASLNQYISDVAFVHSLRREQYPEEYED